MSAPAPAWPVSLPGVDPSGKKLPMSGKPAEEEPGVAAAIESWQGKIVIDVTTAYESRLQDLFKKGDRSGMCESE
jgi:hypothetical protein